MDNQKKQVADKLKEAKNVLITVSADPSVDQLAACIGLTLMLNKLGKHASAVFSGKVPSTIDFLKPEETLESNTNSLRDFIIALDKSKADKLRYKVEDKVVRIFITPYKTSIGEDDLEFSEGDFNVDVVVALGVKQQQDIDGAVTAQGNILHDATVITMTTSDESGLGSIHWRDPASSGVSELAASLSDSFDKEVLDEQIATAFLTGIVAQTDRFSNNLTSSNTMKVSAQLMAAGADQQLVAAKLDQSAEPSESEDSSTAEPKAKDDKNEDNQEASEKTEDADNGDKPSESPKTDPGMLEIAHQDDQDATDRIDKEKSETSEADNSEKISDEPDSNDSKTDEAAGNPAEEPDDGSASLSRKVLQDGGQGGPPFTANSKTEELESAIDPLGLPPLDRPVLEGKSPKVINSDTRPAETSEEDQSKPAGKETDSPAKEEHDEPPKQLPSFKSDSSPADTSASDKPQTLDDIQSSLHKSSSETNGDKPSQLPSVSINPNGQLVNNDQPLRPAPGFESPQPPVNPTPPMNPAPELDDKPDEASPPPVPPPMVPPQ